jgi:hypothetical protein
MAARCERTDLLVESCGHCTGAEARAAREEKAERGPWFRAAYPGRCSECGEEFEEGTDIRADGKGGYLAEACGGNRHG